MNNSLQGRKLIVCVTGSIAAYKSAVLIRLLVKSGAEVQVLMTASAKEFISELTLSTLSKRPVISSLFSDGDWNNHVSLGLWADAMIIAPCTAVTLSKCAQGLSDNMVVATYLSAKCPVFFAPAMDLDMWHHGSTKQNLDRLNSYGDQIIPVGHGELASGLVGDGRMAEPEEIVSFIQNSIGRDLPLEGKKVLVNAGPTYEAIDPVRFIGNRSSGKMGIAIAEAFAKQGALVTLVLGPTKLSVAHTNITTTHVISAQEMYEASVAAFSSSDIAVLAAAVADFTPQDYADQKIKKTGDDLSLVLKRTKDIALALGQEKKKNQILVGFALETHNEKENAFKKVKKKNFDFIVMNSLNDVGAGFQTDTNKVTFIFPDNKEQNFQLKSKKEVAQDIVAATQLILASNENE